MNRDVRLEGYWLCAAHYLAFAAIGLLIEVCGLAEMAR